MPTTTLSLLDGAAPESSKHRWPARLAAALGILALAAAAYAGRARFAGHDAFANVASGNGRIEATELDISAKSPGRLVSVLVEEGDLVQAGQVLAHIDTSRLEAQRREAEAQLRRAAVAIDMAKSLVVEREAERRQAIAIIAQRKAQLDAAARRFARTEQLAAAGSLSAQVLDDDHASMDAQVAAKAAAEAQLASADAAIAAAKIQVLDGEAARVAAAASIEAIATEIADADLKAPRDGRVQLRVAQPGEVVSAGSRVLSIVDLRDVSMTFFLPTEQAGRVAIGADARIVLDASPKESLPAQITYVAPVAQFTPKTVETKDEREKLMFRVKARLPMDLLRRRLDRTKGGLPGVAYVRLDDTQDWPAKLPSVVRE